VAQVEGPEFKPVPQKKKKKKKKSGLGGVWWFIPIISATDGRILVQGHTQA
jgi:hypothetical protein